MRLAYCGELRLREFWYHKTLDTRVVQDLEVAFLRGITKGSGSSVYCLVSDIEALVPTVLRGRKENG